MSTGRPGNLESMPDMMNEHQVAEVFGIAVQTLRRWRCCGTSELRYVKVGKAVRYRKPDVAAFIQENLSDRRNHA